MDAGAYLRRQGWRGEGHSLDHTGHGIKKPLLISKKVDVLGVGLNKHTAVSDQWWLRAFDQGLKTLGSGQQSVLSQVQKHGVNRGGLYGRFVKGEGVPGTFDRSSFESTPTDDSEPVVEQSQKIAIEILPLDKRARVVGEHLSENGSAALLHNLEHTEDVPSGMLNMVDRKRKRVERPVEKRARRKTERHDKTSHQQREAKQKAIEEGTLDEEKEQGRKEAEINRKAKAFVLEAQRRGIIPLGPKEIRKGLVSDADSTAVPLDPNSELGRLVQQTGLDTQTENAKKGSEIAQKYARDKMKRELKRAAKAYLTGEKLEDERTREEKQAKKEKKGVVRRKEAQGQETLEGRIARREERALKKGGSRANRKAERAVIDKVIALRDAAEAAGLSVEEYEAQQAAKTDTSTATSDACESELDHNNLEIDSKCGPKKESGKGVVKQHPNKAAKKLKKIKAMAIDQQRSVEEIQLALAAEQRQKQVVEQMKVDRYRAMKHGMSLQQYRTALAKGEVFVPKIVKKNIPKDKLEQYMERAQEKGMSLEAYIKRREEKYAMKQAEKLGNP